MGNWRIRPLILDNALVMYDHKPFIYLDKTTSAMIIISSPQPAPTEGILPLWNKSRGEQPALGRWEVKAWAAT